MPYHRAKWNDRARGSDGGYDGGNNSGSNGDDDTGIRFCILDDEEEEDTYVKTLGPITITACEKYQTMEERARLLSYLQNRSN
jgi:hypothetical protein